jgi:hypothetical protein
MIALVFAMILCLLLGLAVVGLVAIPARREGRDVLTPRGEEVVSRVRERTEAAATVARHKTGALMTTTRSKVSDPTTPPDVDPAVEAREAT